MVSQARLPDPAEERRAALVGPRDMKPVGSPEWCWQTIELLRLRFERKRDTAEMFEQTLRELEETRAWEKVPPGRPYGSEEVLLRQELGVAGPVEAVDIKRRQVQERADAPEDLGPVHSPGTGRGNKTVDKVNGFSGNGASYLTARIARDRPDILERMKAGEYRSVRAAALEAGIVKPTVTVPADPARAARILAKHFDVAELIRQLALIGAEG